ncbi:MAG TPA: histidine phosphatase family protein [Kofleriaceae bacterium]|nr:histidine phosphatase family protein [Kofleriaceae bacterium]
MASLALVRHGQASFGASDYDRLSDRGGEQARALGVRWAATPPAAIYSGPMRRQLDTARIAREAARAAGRELPDVIELPGLAEMPAFELLARCLPEVAREHVELRALVDGTAAGSARAALFDLAFWKVLDGWSRGRFELGTIEPYDAFVERVEGALGWMTARHRQGGELIAAVTSGGPIAIAVRAVLGLAGDPTFKLWRVVRNASVTELLWRTRDGGRAGELSLLGFNHVDHLPAELHTYR